MADPLSATSAVSSGVTTALRLFQVIYEIQAVGEQTQDLLETTKLVTESVTQVKKLRHQKSSLPNNTENAYIDNSTAATENAVKNVAILVERARVDMETKNGRAKDNSLMTRASYVLKDSPKVATNINRMSIATQGLKTSMGILCSRTGTVKASPYRSHSSAVDRRASSPKPPPPYELVEFSNGEPNLILNSRANSQGVRPSRSEKKKKMQSHETTKIQIGISLGRQDTEKVRLLQDRTDIK